MEVWDVWKSKDQKDEDTEVKISKDTVMAQYFPLIVEL